MFVRLYFNADNITLTAEIASGAQCKDWDQDTMTWASPVCSAGKELNTTPLSALNTKPCIPVINGNLSYSDLSDIHHYGVRLYQPSQSGAYGVFKSQEAPGQDAPVLKVEFTHQCQE